MDDSLFTEPNTIHIVGNEHASAFHINVEPIDVAVTTDFHGHDVYSAGYTYHDTQTGDYNISCQHNVTSDANSCTGTWSYSK